MKAQRRIGNQRCRAAPMESRMLASSTLPRCRHRFAIGGMETRVVVLGTEARNRPVMVAE